ncbi:hypothetical protein ACUV84_039067 [Puccinellia chinampoensis]
MDAADADCIRYVTALSSARQTRKYLRDVGERRFVVVRVLEVESIGSASRMRKLLEAHLAADRERKRTWEIRGRDHLDAAADLHEPISEAMRALVVLLERIAGGFSFGRGVTLAHGAIPVPLADGGGPGGIGLGVFDRPHHFKFVNAHGLTLAYGNGYRRLVGSIGQVLLRRASAAGMTFADKSETVDPEGGQATLLECEQALRHTKCAPVSEQALELAERLRSVRRVVRDFAADFDNLSRLTRRRSRRTSRSWMEVYNPSFLKLQEDRIAVLERIHEVGVQLLSFVSRPIRFPLPPMV